MTVGALGAALAIGLLSVALGADVAGAASRSKGSGAAARAVPTAAADIATGGPLEHVYAGEDLSCQVRLQGDVDLSFFPPDSVPGDCGTLLNVAGTLYEPDFENHEGGSATDSLPPPETPFTLVSQTPVSGAGTAANPFAVTTVADAGATGLRITQRDTYVAGRTFYLSEITVSNSGAARNASLYHAADCFLANTDNGFGFVDTEHGGIYCSANANNSPPARIIGFQPADAASAGATYIEDDFDTVWAAIDGSAFPNTCICPTLDDNGAGLEWNISVPAGGQVTRKVFTTLSPTGEVPPVEPPPNYYENECPGFTLTGTSVQGDDANDNITGTPGNDLLRGGGGNDNITGLPGDDCINGQNGNDAMTGDDGNDFILGEDGNDDADGGAGNDTITLGNEPDTSVGGTGNDSITGDAGADTLNGDDGTDLIKGFGDNDKISGDADNDRVQGSGGNDKVTGADGKDKVRGGTGNDKVDGGKGNDQVQSQGGKDKISGGAQEDNIRAGGGNDKVKAADGFKDKVKCGLGNDKATVDKIDVVSPDCNKVKVKKK